MTTLQLGFLFAVAAPFILAVWVARNHRRQAPMRGGTIPREVAEGAVLGLTRAVSEAQTLDLEAELGAGMEALEGLALARFVRLELAVGQGATVRIDAVVLRAVLRSILGSAIRSTADGQVLVTALALGSQMHIRIIDDGVDADQTSREIMLREAGELLALQGGSLAVEARPGQGTTVTIRLPLPGGAGVATSDYVAVLAPAAQET
jgi:signal transduction histidine kinase